MAANEQKTLTYKGVFHFKGLARVLKDATRVEEGEPKNNFSRNREPHCRFPKGGKAFRLKGRNRYKTGKKRQKKGKSAR